MTNATKLAWHVWGVGGARSDIVRTATAADEWPKRALTECRKAAGEDGHGDPGGWCVEVEATEDELDAATRHDQAVLGFAAYGRQWVVAVGDPFDGLSFHGPMDDSEGFDEEASPFRDVRTWWTVLLDTTHGAEPSEKHAVVTSQRSVTRIYGPFSESSANKLAETFDARSGAHVVELTGIENEGDWP